MTEAKPEHIKEEMTLIGNVWNVLKSAVDGHPCCKLEWKDVIEASHRLETVVATCCNPLVKKFAEQMSLNVIRYISTEQMGDNHDDEVKVVNGMARLLKLGYWIKYDGDEAAEDWEELINRARAIAGTFPDTVVTSYGGVEPDVIQNKIVGFASAMYITLVEYLEKISEARFNKAMNKADEINEAKVS